MSDDPQSKLERYLKGELCVQRSREKQIAKFVLRSAAPGSKGSPIETWEIEEKVDPDEIPSMAMDILGRAQTDAEGIGPGNHSYCLHCYLEKEKNSTSRYRFRLSGVENEWDESSGEEGPSLKGLVQQQMRHNEALVRQNVIGTQAIMNMMVGRMGAMDKRMAELEADRRESFVALEAAKSQQHERDVMQMQEVGSESRKDKAFEKLMSLAPAVVNRIVGMKMLPEPSNPLMMMLEQLIEGMNMDQFQAIQQSLNPEQTIQFVEILQTFQKRKAEKAEKQKKDEKEN